MADAKTRRRSPGGMSEERRRRLRLEISREAARLFWEQGVAATNGEQIAAAVGLSVRTLWRHFRTKESCAEPIVTRCVHGFVESMRRWPRELSLEEHFAAERRDTRRTPGESADELAALRLVVLGESEPALRSAWLMACDEVEREVATIFADRLRRPETAPDIRTHAAAACAALRVLTESLAPAILSGTGAVPGPSDTLARTVRTVTAGAVGDPVAP